MAIEAAGVSSDVNFLLCRYGWVSHSLKAVSGSLPRAA